MTFANEDDDRPPRRRTTALPRLVLVLTVLAALIAAGLTPIALGVGVFARDAADRFLQARCNLRDATPPQRSTLFARDGKTVLARHFTQNRAPVRLADVPPALLKALIDTEDRRFYEHHGIDVQGMLRAALHDLAGGSTQGGSTLTMQYVKQVRYYEARNAAERQAAIAPNLARKLENARCALDLEHRYTKAQILKKYLEIAFFGENSYGITTAARTYFDLPTAKLSVPQSALLVGLLRAPTQYDPFMHPVAARIRRNEVIGNMLDVGDLDRAAAARYQQAPLGLASERPPPVAEGCAAANPSVPNAGFFCDYAVAWLHAHGISAHELDTGGLRIVTTLDPRLQSHGQRAIWRAGLKPAADYILVMPSVDPRTGDVTSMITSRRYGVRAAHKSESSEPLFTTAYAGAGSTYKYFTAAAALSAGAPTSLRLTTTGNRYRTHNCDSGAYRVHNAGSYPDTMALRDALPQSSNTYFVALEDEFFGCRLGPVVDTALRLGMDRLRARLTPAAATSIAKEVVRSEEPTFTLGQEPTSALELTGAFAAAANDGVFCPPSPILKVTRMDGSAVPVGRPHCRRELSPYVARTLVRLMRRDTHDGTAAGYFGRWYARGGSDVAGKTGTDNNAADNGNSSLWFVGMTPRLVAAAALVNPRQPKQTVHGLPGMPGAWVGQDVFGAYASTYWLDAYRAALRRHWSWPSAGALPGARVPHVVGRTEHAATAALRSAGFRVRVFPVACGSSRPEGIVAYQQPPRATPGTPVTICLSSGKPPYVYVPPPIIIAPPSAPQPKPKPKPKPKPPHHAKPH